MADQNERFDLLVDLCSIALHDSYKELNKSNYRHFAECSDGLQAKTRHDVRVILLAAAAQNLVYRGMTR